MDDTMLFLTGLSAFGLMIIGIVFTVVEFRAVGKRDGRRNAANISSSSADEN
ncbi:MAG: hypothetical protein OES53_02170 [Xanthomonadales bacterium]|jgi:hypothetical protein|nr:hypothetical protein [Xanthomonadales bacterium]MDH3925359.1 hypothetical protein [Xanthomonadales bacterium]MDH3940975.1 hypothetical protein [Xanthomonadales bacterium]MDH4000560.1 hypothetical protein [Xanthomonadales bacterium]